MADAAGLRLAAQAQLVAGDREAAGRGGAAGGAVVAGSAQHGVAHRRAFAVGNLPRQAAFQLPAIVQPVQHAGRHGVGVILVAGVFLTVALAGGIHRRGEVHARRHAEAARQATLHVLVAAGVDLQPGAGREVAIQRHGRQRTAQVAAPHEGFPDVLQQVGPHAPAFLTVDGRPQVGMGRQRPRIVDAQPQRVGARDAGTLLHEVEDPRTGGRPIERTGHAVEHLQVIELLHRVFGGTDDVEPVGPAVLDHAALHTPCLRTCGIGLHPGQRAQRITHTQDLLVGQLGTGQTGDGIGGVHRIPFPQGPHLHAGLVCPQVAARAATDGDVGQRGSLLAGITASQATVGVVSRTPGFVDANRAVRLHATQLRRRRTGLGHGSGRGKHHQHAQRNGGQDGSTPVVRQRNPGGETVFHGSLKRR